MKYAVISLKNNQYKISEGEELLVDRIDKKELKPDVLLYVDDDEVQIGKPVLKKAKIDIDHLGDEKGEKIHVRKFKAKSRYRRKKGFRPMYTRVKVNKISA